VLASSPLERKEKVPDFLPPIRGSLGARKRRKGRAVWSQTLEVTKKQSLLEKSAVDFAVSHLSVEKDILQSEGFPCPLFGGDGPARAGKKTLRGMGEERFIIIRARGGGGGGGGGGGRAT